jgi:predicted nucleic acid-binding protein
MSSPRKLYWDSSCFICFLNADEKRRREICDDVLRHAESGEVEIWISIWVIVEVIRPRRAGNAPLPEWAVKAIKAVPEAQKHLEELWTRYQRKDPRQKLTAEVIQQIQSMFEWAFLKKVQVDEPIARKAVELSRDFGLHPADAIHAATAILYKCDVIQRWDKDYSKVSHLIPSEEPQMISAQHTLPLRPSGDANEKKA